MRVSRIGAVGALVTAGCVSFGSVGAWGAADGSHRVGRAAVGPAPSAACRSATSAPHGKASVSLTVAGVPRQYLRHVPPSADTTHPLPLVVDLPGYEETAAIQALMSRLGPYGDTHGFVTVTPQGLGPDPHWDTRLGSTDLQFFGQLLDTVEHTVCIDQRRVFVTGLSNGAMMTSAVACAYADRVAPVAPVAGIEITPGCKPKRPVPVVAFHGTADPLLAFTGGLGPKALNLPAPDGSHRTLVESGAAAAYLHGPSVPAIATAWAKRNHCASRPTSRAVASDVTLVRYRCPGHANVDFYRITGGGHTWPGSNFSQAIANVVGPTTFSISADDVEWSFFVHHPLSR